MFDEFYAMQSCPAVDELKKVIDTLETRYVHAKACYDANEALWNNFMNDNAPCTFVENREVYIAWLDSERVSARYERYSNEAQRLENNLKWFEKNIMSLKEVFQSLEYMDTDGLLPKC